MKNLDSVTQPLPWDHEFEFKSRIWRTRPPTLGEMIVIERGLKGQADAGTMLETIQSLIVGDCSVGGWSDEQLRVFIEDYFGFFAAWQRAKAAARKTGNQPAMTSSTPGNSSQAS